MHTAVSEPLEVAMAVEDELRHIWTLAGRAIADVEDPLVADLLVKVADEAAGALTGLETLPTHRAERLSISAATELGLLPTLETLLCDRPPDGSALEELLVRCLRPLRRYVQDQ